MTTIPSIETATAIPPAPQTAWTPLPAVVDGRIAVLVFAGERAPCAAAPAACPPFTPPARPRFAIWTTGDWYGRACEVAARLGGDVVHARCLKPFDAARLAAQRAAGLTVVSLENGCVAGGLGESLGADVKFGWPDAFIPHGTPDELERANGLDVESLVRRLAARLPPR